MPKYVSTVDRLISHEGRVVKAGEVFETTFPKEMKLGSTLKEVKEAKEKKPKAETPPDNPPADPPADPDLV